jgi:hypothetical protein
VLKQVIIFPLSTLIYKKLSKGEILDKVIPFITGLLKFTLEEKEFLDKYLDKGEYRPDILFKKCLHFIPDNVEKHPALLWKKINIDKHLRNK